jgi:tetratricopeptide (TPR) repeat protein
MNRLAFLNALFALLLFSACATLAPAPQRSEASVEAVAPPPASPIEMPAPEPTIDDLIAQGLSAETARRLNEATRHYEAALAREPNHRQALQRLGKLLLKKREGLARGIELSSIALKSAPFDPEWLNARALFLLRAGNVEAAKADLRQLLSRSPKDSAAYATLTRIALAQGERGLAELFSKRGLELAPNDAVAHLCRALAIDGSHPTSAARSLRRAIELDPTLTEAWFELGNLALEHRDYRQAHEAFERVQALDPDHLGLSLHLAWTFEGLRSEDGMPRLAEARALYERHLEQAPNDAEALLDLAKLFAGALKEPAKALPLYERALAAMQHGPRREAARQAFERVKQRVELGAEVEAAESQTQDR